MWKILALLLCGAVLGCGGAETKPTGPVKVNLLNPTAEDEAKLKEAFSTLTEEQKAEMRRANEKFAADMKKAKEDMKNAVQPKGK